MKSHKATYSHHEKVTRNSFAFSVLFLLFCEFNLQFKPKDRGEREKLYLENILSKHNATEMLKDYNAHFTMITAKCFSCRCHR